MSQKSVVAQAVAEHCGNDIVAAVTAQNSADGKWERAARSLFKQGARVEMLKRKPRGPEFDESLETVVEAFIVQAMTAGKPFKFSAGSFTFAQILDLDRHQLRELDDKVISNTKRDCIQTVASRYGLIVRHLDKFQNPIKVQAERDAAKAAKEEAESETVDPIVTLQGWVANAVKMVDIADVDRFKDSGLEMIACLRRIRKS
jgi:hypothetical protein